MRKFLLITGLALALSTVAKVETSHLFVHLSDAMAALKKGEPNNAHTYLSALQTEFESLPTHHSNAGQAVHSALKIAKSDPNDSTLTSLSKALLTFEKEQNPIDYQAKRAQFAKRVMPVYQQLHQAIATYQTPDILTLYKRFNTTWTANEKIVRETSLAHYRQIETTMALLRIAILAEPINIAEMQQQAQQLGTALTDFIDGKNIQSTISSENAPRTLAQGIALLEQSYQAFTQGDIEQAQTALKQFILHWGNFANTIRTRDLPLYHRVENDLPLIAAKGSQPETLANFRALIDALLSLEQEK